MSKSDADVVFGGPTRTPKMEQMIKQFFDVQELCKSMNHDTAVAYGAAVQAAILSGDEIGGTGDVFFFIDVTPLSLDISTAGGIMTKLIQIIERNRTISYETKETFTTCADNQPGILMSIQVFEGKDK